MIDLPVPPRPFWGRNEQVNRLPPTTAAYEIQGAVDIAQFERSLQIVVERHEMLRSAFEAIEDDGLRPVVYPARRVPLASVELDALPPADQRTTLELLAVEEAQRPFDIAVPPLIRVMLIRQAVDRYVLMLAAHRLIADAASLDVIARDLAVAYSADPTGTRPALSAPPRRFAEFVAEREAALSAAGNSCSDQDSQSPDGPVLQLPGTSARSSTKGLRTKRRSRTMSSEMTAQMESRARSLGVDPGLLLLASFGALLCRYSGETSAAIRAVVSNRDKPEWKDVVGPFQTAGLVRIDMDDAPSLSLLLQRTREAWRHANDYGAPPLTRAHIQFEWVHHAPAPWPSVTLEARPFAADSTLRVARLPHGLELEIECRHDLFESPALDRVLDHLEVLLSRALSQPDVPLAHHPVVTGDEQQRLLHEWNDTAKLYPRDRCVHEFVEQQAAQTPRALAVTACDGSLTYQELDERANGLAHHLRTLGIGPDVIVGVAAERRATTIIAMLAVLKAGGAYVPLDPALPRERLRFAMDDARIRVMLAAPSVADTFPIAADRVVDPTDARWSSAHPPTPRAVADNLAYLIYTSGSTGLPKAVMVAHRQIVNSTLARFGYYPSPISSYLMAWPLMFDGSVGSIYYTLFSGGRLLIPTEAQARDPRLLARLTAEEKPSHFEGVPSHYAMLLDSRPEVFATLRLVILGGEPLPSALVARHLRDVGQARLENEYGPTETTVWATGHTCSPSDARASVPIGRPIANLRSYVLDPCLNLQPIGVPGELFVGGDGVTRGYLNRPALTAERYVPNPFGTAAGERLYRTGDLVRYLPDGRLEFIDRVDTQVKVRGHRIELGEIEAAIQSHSDVALAAVTTREMHKGDVRLLAFVVRRAGESPDAEELRALLGRTLPAYMVPQFTFVSDLPTTLSGKIDRKALTRLSSAEPHGA